MPKKNAKAVPRNQGIRYRYRKDGSLRGYEVRYRDLAGDVRGKTFRTLDEAKRWQTATARDIQTGQYVRPEDERLPWRTVADAWLAARGVRLRARTVESYQGILVRWLAPWDKRAIGSITREDVRRVMRAVRDKELTEETEHRVFNVISAVLRFAVKEGYIKRSPADDVRDELRSPAHKTFRARHLTVAEANRIIDQLPAGRYRLFGLLGLWTGFRAGELAGLRVRNLDTLRNVVQADETVEDVRGELQAGIPKTVKSRGRRVPVPKEVMAEVVACVQAKRLPPDAYLFADQGQFFRHGNFYKRQWKDACTAAGITGVRFYDLRHTFASLRAQQGVPPHVLKEWMGHSSIVTTMNVYAHVYDEDATTQDLLARLYADATPAPSSVPTPLRGSSGG